MRHGSLFSGIGGFDLAAEWMGWENMFHCEKNIYCQRVLKKNFPGVPLHDDITKTDFSPYANTIDILTGGDPCQPHSTAGKKAGKEDDRYLWSEYRRAITEINPRWIVNENVAGSIYNGVLDDKINQLESLGYSWWPPVVIPAGALGALHRRDRIWLVAYSEWRVQQQAKSCNGEIGRMGRENKPISWNPDWENALRVFRGMDDGLSYGVDRVDGIRNAVVPQIPYEIFKAIEQFELKQAI